MKYTLSVIGPFGILVLSLVLSPTSVVLAQTPQRMSIDAAEKLIREGDRFADQADFSQAVDKYTEAYLGIVSKIRGQEYLRPVKPTLMTRSELGEEMQRQFALEYTAAELKLMDASFKAFGLVPAHFNVGETMTKLLTEEVGGFYDPRTKAMVLVREDDPKSEPTFLSRLFGARPTFDKDEQKITLSHELTHALQDQHYGLQAMQESIEKDDDMLMAFSALVEGDATLVMFGEMGRQDGDIKRMTEMEPQMAEFMFGFMKMMLPVAGGKTYRNSPPVFRDGLIFPYFQGMVFNLNLSRKGGFERIHQAYQTPPLSTEQILHPDKYLGERDDPMAITIPKPEQLLPEPWKYLGGNCLGEFQIGILLKQIAGGGEAARGWDGDRYEVFEGPEDRLALVWHTTWDSPADAQQFASAIERYCEKQREDRLKPVKSTVRDLDSADNDSPALSPEEAAHVEAEWQVHVDIHESDVILFKGVPAELTTNLKTAVENATKSVKQFPVQPKRVDEAAPAKDDKPEEKTP